MANVTRRNLLKRAGVGAAAVGAGAMVTATSAQATENASTACMHVGGCGPFIDCHSALHECCGCVITVEGCCFCMENVYCNGLHPCSSSAQCPPGWACATGGCGADPGLCVPACGTGSPNHAPCDVIDAASGGSWKGGGTAHGGGHHPEPETPPHGGHGHA